jgi:hypothetical protein
MRSSQRTKRRKHCGLPSSLGITGNSAEYVLDYLAHSFPTQLFEEYTDSDGNLASRPVLRDGQPVERREAVQCRDRLIEHLASLDPVPGALDQIVQHFGSDQVAEVTGRSRRIVGKTGSDGNKRLAVESRPGSANLAETQAFQNGEKRILVFSDGAPSPRDSARPEGRACSGPRTTWRACTHGPLCASSTCCSMPARSRAARCDASLTQPASP